MAKTMSPSYITDGQIDKLVAKLRDALRKNRNQFPKSVSQQILGTDNLGMTLLAPFSELVHMCGVVKFRGTSTVEIMETRLPANFFSNSNGLWVKNSLQEIVSNVAAFPSGTKCVISCFEVALKNGAKDTQIKRAVGNEGRYLFEMEQALALAAELISRQKNGKTGLLHTRLANLLFVDFRVLQVRWNIDYKGWEVQFRRPDDLFWREQTRVFVPCY